jgi:lipopolysaccharide transport system permease protein
MGPHMKVNTLHSETIKFNVHPQKKIRYLIDLISQEAMAGLRAEASRAYLGVLWWVIEPVMYMGVFYFVFAHLYQRGDENYVMFILIGLIVWKWFQATLNTGASSLMNNAGLMNLVYLPKIVFPLANIAVNTFKFLIIVSLFLIFLQFTAIQPSLTWMFLPILVMTQLLLIMSVTCLLAALMPFFPDLRAILDNILLMLFFASGVFFDISRLPGSIQGYLMLNPMATLITMYRELLIKGLAPNWNQLMLVNLFSFSVMLLSVWLFLRFDRVYPKIIH